MNIREAKKSDIQEMQVIRNSVKENILSDPNLVSDNDYKEFLFERGKGWVCEIGNQMVGFSIVDLKENNIWALFVHPNFENMGIGRELQNIMLDWYFEQTDKSVWLGTAFKTRAEGFYEKFGWQNIGMHGTKETKFEMTYNNWKKEKQ
ncbi:MULTISPECIES: GNAT family N-acetyltransferase [Chryseobacterium]|uniref:GNAT family N-acetyltransferase n=1 Tax=Chryseobacterium TaxID=59732 RepID=UPI001BE58DEE|nr:MULTISPECIES: GNAT family N-acetyltransferase [Chryseobacterium]MBT2619719.1 GNAT family N-acetyltransferase [Chryseobacterium sp. ISL-6]